MFTAMKTHACTAIRALGAILAFTGAAARADLPAVLDLVPPQTPVVVAVRSLDRLDEARAELFDAAGIRGLASLQQVWRALGINEGIDPSGSAAAILSTDQAPPAAPKTLVLLPVRDADAFARAVSAVPEDAGLMRFETAGEAYWLRTINPATLAISSDRTMLAAYDPAPGQLAAHARGLGARALGVAERSDVIALCDPDRLGPLLGATLAPLLSGQPALGLPAGDDADPRPSLAHALIERLTSDAGRTAFGVSMSPRGLRIEAAAGLREGSSLARALAAPPAPPAPAPAAAQWQREVPAGEALFLGHIHLAHPGVRAILRDAAPEPPDAPARALLSADAAWVAVLAPTSLMQGLLTRTVIAWSAPDAGVAAGALGAWVTSLDGREVEGGRLSARWLDKPQGIEPPAWAWAIDIPPEAAGIGPMLYGTAPGPSGFVATRGTRGVCSWGPTPDLLLRALEVPAARDEPGAEPKDRAFRRALGEVDAVLPSPRAVEWFVNLRPVLKVFGPMLARGDQGGAQLPEALAPMGAALVMDAGGIEAAMFVPAPLIELVASQVQAAQGARPAPPPPEPAGLEAPR